jgi:hypothetical protein
MLLIKEQEMQQSVLALWILSLQQHIDCGVFVPSLLNAIIHQEDGWAMQLLAVTCLSLAAKMEETLVPSLLDLQAITLCFLTRPNHRDQPLMNRFLRLVSHQRNDVAIAN